MNNRMIAALLLSSVVISTSAFAGNAHLGDDVENWAGPSVLTRAQVQEQLVASEKANQYSHETDANYPQLAATGPGKTRAQVYQELVDAEKSGELARENEIYRGS